MRLFDVATSHALGISRDILLALARGRIFVAAGFMILSAGCVIAPSIIPALEENGLPGCNFPKVDKPACEVQAARSNCLSVDYDENREDTCLAYECSGVSQPSPPDPFRGTSEVCSDEGYYPLLALPAPSDGAQAGVPASNEGASSILRASSNIESTRLKSASAGAAVTISEFALAQPGVAPGPIVAAGQRLVFSSVANPCKGACDVFEMTTGGAVTATGTACANPDSCRHSGLTQTADGGYCYTTVNDRYPAGAPHNGRLKPDVITCVTPGGRYIHKLHMANGFVAGLALGADGKIWYTDAQWNGVGRIDVPDTNKVRAAYLLGSSQVLGFGSITRGPDASSLWFTVVSIGQLGRITSKGLEILPLPTKFSDPSGITLGPDGNIWFTEMKGNKIGRVTMAGVVTEFPLPTANAMPLGIAAGPDGALWFTEINANKIGRITESGEITEYAIPTADSQPAGITAGPDGNMWFTELKGNKIGRVNLPLAGLPSVVEFYNTILDNYFITANPAEQAAIDGGSAGPGWTRTGSVFASGGSSSVCRFYGSISPGPNSHFYTADLNECASLKALQATTPATQKRWNYESNDFNTTPAVNGACTSGLTPIYRAYNNGFGRGIDSNHRITPSAAAIASVVGRGWTSEGVVMCSP